MIFFPPPAGYYDEEVSRIEGTTETVGIRQVTATGQVIRCLLFSYFYDGLYCTSSNVE